MLGRCPLCWKGLDPEAAVIVEQKNGDVDPSYEPFLNDLRTRPHGLRFTHPACYARKHGIDVLIDVLHKRDVRDRGHFASPS